MFTIDPAVFRPESITAETAKFNEWLEAALAEGPALHEVPPAVTRQARLEGKGLLPSGGPLEGSDWRPAPTEAGEVRISLPKGDPTGIFIHIHGGGWTIGSPTQCDDWMQYLAAETGCVCVSVKYRLGPEEPWPAAPGASRQGVAGNELDQQRVVRVEVIGGQRFEILLSQCAHGAKPPVGMIEQGRVRLTVDERIAIAAPVRRL